MAFLPDKSIDYFRNKTGWVLGYSQWYYGAPRMRGDVEFAEVQSNNFWFLLITTGNCK